MIGDKRVRALGRGLWLMAALFWATGAMAQDQAPQGPPPAVVKLAPVQMRNVERVVTLNADAQAHRSVTVASQVAGLVRQGLVEEGQRVKGEQPLVRLDDDQLALMLAEAQAGLAEAQAQLDQYQRDFRRLSQLYDNHSVPLKSLEDARTARDRQNSLVARAQQAVKQLQLDRRYSTIVAPLAGVITQRLAWKGEWVDKGGPVARLVVLDPIKAVVMVPERFIAELEPGEKVCGSADALPGKQFCGEIQAVIPQADSNSRAFPVQVRLANPAGEILPGMMLRLNLGVGQAHDALLVPKDALVLSATGSLVYANLEGKAAPIPVKVVASHDGLAEVEGELKAGMQVVVTGNERLFPGQPLAPLPAAGQAQPAAQGSGS